MVPNYFSRDYSTDSISCSERKKTNENIIADSEVVLLLLRCRRTIAPLSLHCCRSCCCYAVTPAIASAVAPLSLRCCSAVAPLSPRCLSAVTPLLISCCSTVALLPILLIYCRCCLFCCRYALTTVIAPDVTSLSLLLLLWCRSGVALVSLCYRSVISLLSLRCCSAAADITAAVAPAVAPAVTPLLSL